HRVPAEVALKKPRRRLDVLSPDDEAAGAVARQVHDAIQHQHWRRRQTDELVRRIADEGALRQREQLQRGELGPAQKFAILHHLVTSTQRLPQLNPEPTAANNTSSPTLKSSQRS